MRRLTLLGSFAIVAVALVVACGDDPLPVTPSQPGSVAGESRNVSGDYTLTLESASSCNRPLAVELRRRSYDATVTQDGSRLQVVLTESRFVPWTVNRFSGTVTKTGATFVMGADTAWFTDVMERLPDGSTLQVYGIADTTGSSGALSGRWSGWVSHDDANGGSLGLCDGSRFTLSPR